MKKLKLWIILGIGIFILGLTACDVKDVASLITTDSSKNEISYVEEKDEENVETETPDLVEDDTNNTDTTNDNSEQIITNKYELLAEKLYQYEQDYETLYGYNELGNDRYGSLMQDVYKSFYQDAHDFLASSEDYEIYSSSSFDYIIIGEYEYKNSKYTDIIASAWITFIEENPLYYFTYTAYTIKTNGSGNNKTYSFLFLGGTDYAKAEDRYEANEAVLNMLEEFYLEYENFESKDDYSVSKMIHDYICNKIEYAYDEEGNASEEYWAHNILGVALKGNGVCECYAETYLLFSYLTDLDCLIVLGESGGGGHVWNYVNVDGVWYGLDATWDDGDEINYDYFLVSDRIMSKAHQANNSYYYGIDYQVDLPELSTSSYDTSKDVVDNHPVYPVYPIIIPGPGYWPRYR